MQVKINKTIKIINACLVFIIHPQFHTISHSWGDVLDTKLCDKVCQ